jgi:hypothetical protein
MKLAASPAQRKLVETMSKNRKDARVQVTVGERAEIHYMGVNDRFPETVDPRTVATLASLGVLKLEADTGVTKFYSLGNWSVTHDKRLTSFTTEPALPQEKA